MLSRDSSNSSVSYELFRDNHAREYFKPTKIPGWQCHASRGDWWILLSHFSPPMIFPELATGFSELKSSPLSRALEFLPGTGTGFLPANDSGLAGGKGLPEKHIARGQLGKLSRENLCCLASGTRLGIWRGKREVNSRYFQVCSWSWPWWWEKKKEKIPNSVLPLTRDGINKRWHDKEWKENIRSGIVPEKKKGGCHPIWIWVCKWQEYP